MYLSVLPLFLVVTLIVYYVVKTIDNKKYKIIMIILWCVFVVLILLFLISWQDTQRNFREIKQTINEIKIILEQMK